MTKSESPQLKYLRKKVCQDFLQRLSHEDRPAAVLVAHHHVAVVVAGVEVHAEHAAGGRQRILKSRDGIGEAGSLHG